MGGRTMPLGVGVLAAVAGRPSGRVATTVGIFCFGQDPPVLPPRNTHRTATASPL